MSDKGENAAIGWFIVFLIAVIVLLISHIIDLRKCSFNGMSYSLTEDEWKAHVGPAKLKAIKHRFK